MTRPEMESVKILAHLFEKNPSEENFNELFLTTKIYFRKEEETYKTANHPDFILHATLHREFERVLFFFHQSFFKEQENIDVAEFCLYVKNWTGLHYECYDDAMLPYLNINYFVEEVTKCKRMRS